MEPATTQDRLINPEGAPHDSRIVQPQVSCSFDGSTVTVSVTGELDITCAPTVWRKVHAAIDRAARSSVVVLDLSNTSFLDSLGITTLINLHQRSRRQQIALRVVAQPGQPVHRVITLAGVDSVLALYDSLDDARTARRPTSIAQQGSCPGAAQHRDSHP